MNSQDRKNKYFFGLGTIGRDMFYTLTTVTFFNFYLTDVLKMTPERFALAGGALTILRIFDALNDPIMGIMVDNTNSRWGKYKPAMLIGALTSAVFFILLFTDLWSSSSAYLLLLILLYLAWDITYGLNDIGYWSMLPALTLDQKKREKIASIARICANIGLFATVVGFDPAVAAVKPIVGGEKQAWLTMAIVISVLMLVFQMFTLFGAKEIRGSFKKEEKTTLRGMAKAIFKNDQLLFTVIAMALFMIGYTTMTGFGKHFFKYAYGDENMFSIFALVLGISQLGALAVFPKFSKRFTRKQLYFASTIIVVAGYILFFFSPMDIIPIGIAAMLIFVGQAFIEVLMLMFLADTIEYGQWKFGKRNQAVTLSVQPLINKLGGAGAQGITTVTLLIAGISEAATSNTQVTPQGIFTLKFSMLILPLLCVVLGYIVYRWKYKIDKKFYDQIVSDLAARGDITEVK